MASFATTADLQTFLGLASLSSTTRAQMVLDQATALIQRMTNQSISQVLAEVRTLDAPAGTRLLLPERPVTAVASVTIGGVALAATAWKFYRFGLVLRVDGDVWAQGWPAEANAQTVVVTHDHGYATIPDEIKGVCLGAAGRALTDNSESAAETLGGPTESAGFAPSVFLTAAEKRTLMRFAKLVFA